MNLSKITPHIRPLLALFMAPLMILWVIFALVACTPKKRDEAGEARGNGIAAQANSVSGSAYLEPFTVQILDQQDYRSTWITMNLQINGCLKEAQDPSQPLANRRYRVEKFIPNHAPFDAEQGSERPSIEVTSDARGCLRWADQYRYRIYGNEMTMVKTALLQDLQSNETHLVAIAIKPHGRAEAKDAREMGVDVTAQTADHAARVFTPEEQARIFVEHLQLDSLATNYKVDNLLGLTIQKNYETSLRLRVARPTVGNGIHEYLANGRYLLRLAIRKPEQERFGDSELIDLIEQVVEVDAGRIHIANLPIEFREIQYIMARNRVQLEIYPVIESANAAPQAYAESGLLPQSFGGNFNPVDETNSLTDLITGDPIDLAGAQRDHAELQQRAETTAGSFNLNNYTATYAFNPILFDQPEGTGRAASLGLNEELVRSLLEQDLPADNAQLPAPIRQLAQRACEQWIDVARLQTAMRSRSGGDRITLPTCAQDPLFYFAIDRKLHVLRVAEQMPVPGNSWTENYGIGRHDSMAFTLARYEYDNSAQGTEYSGGVGTGALGGIPILGPLISGLFNIRLFRNNTNNEGTDARQTQHNRLSLDQGAYLLIQGQELNIRVESYRRCLGVTIRRDFLSHLVQWKENLGESSQYLCLAVSNEPTQILETYFVASQHFNAGVMLDPHLDNLRWIMIMRGYQDYYNFIMATDQSMSESITEVDSLTIPAFIDQNISTFRGQLPSYPGIYTSASEVNLTRASRITERFASGREGVQRQGGANFLSGITQATCNVLRLFCGGNRRE